MVVVNVRVRPDALYARLSGLPRPAFDEAKADLVKRAKRGGMGKRK